MGLNKKDIVMINLNQKKGHGVGQTAALNGEEFLRLKACLCENT